mgnify:CR=1 FL=1
MSTRKRHGPAKMNIPYTGNWGIYDVDDHLTVEYVMTTVHLGNDQSKLEYVKPVREVLDLEELPFEHLLQRDLDDSRTSEEIINGYLADDTNDLPIFFPPLTVALLPRGKDNRVGQYYPERNTIKDDDDTLEWHFGDAFNITFYVDDDGNRESEVQLRVNPSLTHQLAIDGQHRLMALKASSIGLDHITDIHRPLYKGTQQVDLSRTSIPVCFLYFPELTKDVSSSEPRDLVRTARRVFLDVNKNARKPARSREILLDDYDLINYFTSQVFNSIKESDEGKLKLYHTEYDTPSRRTKMTRPLAIVDVLNMQDIISYVLMSKSDVRNNIGSKNRTPRDNSSLKDQLEITDRIKNSFFDTYGIMRSSVTKDDLPKPVTERISDVCFTPYWGKSILYVFQNLYPFNDHLEAVTKLKNRKDAGQSSLEEKLARAMLFEGQGLWWIVQSKADSDIISKDDVAQKAVDTARSWVDEFEAIRAKKYLRKGKRENVSDNDIETVNSLYDLYSSKAFQIAIFMSISYLKEKASIGLDGLFDLTQWFVDSLNHRFSYQTNTVRTVLFNRGAENSLRGTYKDRRLSKSDWTFLRSVLLTLIRDNSDG